ncbi:MAG: regulatory protein RecX [Methylococcaceae bacterium]|nr:regulatory protein RecX [Methylococcaceae bacterium]
MDDCFKQVTDVCLRLLALREHSKQELLQKLTVKGFNKDIALAVIDELAQEGWQDDQRYAEVYARSRILKGFGPVRISYELQQNGIDINAVSLNLEEIVQEAAGSWMNLLEQVYSKKFGHGHQPDFNEWAIRSRFLMQRGFSGAMIRSFYEQLTIL